MAYKYDYMIPLNEINRNYSKLKLSFIERKILDYWLNKKTKEELLKEISNPKMLRFMERDVLIKIAAQLKPEILKSYYESQHFLVKRFYSFEDWIKLVKKFPPFARYNILMRYQSFPISIREQITEEEWLKMLKLFPPLIGMNFLRRYNSQHPKIRERISFLEWINMVKKYPLIVGYNIIERYPSHILELDDFISVIKRYPLLMPRIVINFQRLKPFFSLVIQEIPRVKRELIKSIKTKKEKRRLEDLKTLLRRLYLIKQKKYKKLFSEMIQYNPALFHALFYVNPIRSSHEIFETFLSKGYSYSPLRFYRELWLYRLLRSVKPVYIKKMNAIRGV